MTRKNPHRKHKFTDHMTSNSYIQLQDLITGAYKDRWLSDREATDIAIAYNRLMEENAKNVRAHLDKRGYHRQALLIKAHTIDIATGKKPLSQKAKFMAIVAPSLLLCIARVAGML